MRTWISVVITLSLLSFIVLFEYNINNNFYDYSYKLISILEDNSNTSLKDDLNKLNNHWMKTKKAIYSLSNHSKMEKLDTALFNMTNYLEAGEMDKFKTELLLFKLYLDQTKRENTFLIENVF